MLPNNALEALVLGLNQRFASSSAEEVLEIIINEGVIGKLALVSSFGAESAVLLHMVAQNRKDVPVLFVDTEFLFAETLEYLKSLTVLLKFEDVRRIVPDPARVAIYDPNGQLKERDQDQCCYLRKTLPLQRALGEFAGWITGRKRFQSPSRQSLEYFELDKVTHRIKVNPLIHWNVQDLANYMNKHNLPAHPLVARGYLSIGCKPCTTQVSHGESGRAGRWRGQEKEECGIHFADGKIIQLTKKEVV